MEVANKRYYGWMDVAKLLFSFCVVAIHVSFVFPQMSDWEDLLCDLAVPFFFVTSGYLYGSKCAKSGREAHGAISKKYGIRVLQLYGLWTLIYAPIAWMYLLKHHSFSEAFFYYAKGVLLTGQNMMSWHLWYLLALIVAVLLIHIMHRLCVKPWGMLLAGLAMYGVGVYLDGSDGVAGEWFQQIFGDTQNGLFQGLCYVSIGYCMAHYERYVGNVLLLTAFITAFVFLYFNIPLYYHLLSFALVGMLTRISFGAKWVGNTQTIRSMSTLIYVFHMIPIVVMQQLLHWHSAFHLSLMVVLPVCLAVSYVWVRLSECPKLAFLNKFY